MENKIASPYLSEFGFVKLWTALTVEYNDASVLNRQDIENKIYDFHGNPDYSILFKDIAFYKPENDKGYADLYHGFNLCYIADVLDKDSYDLNYQINIDLDKANEILSSYDENITLPMIKLYNEVQSLESKKRK